MADAGQEKAAGAQYESLDSFYTLYQPYVNNISAYYPIYFLAGTDLSKSKFQISFKYRFFNTDGHLVEKYPWIAGWHFGYTQTSFWNLESSSLPFEDTSYKPELFYLSRNLTAGTPASRGLFFKGGVFHESNGKSDDNSRGINTLYAQPIWVFYNPDNRYGLSLGTKVWGYFSTSEQNTDIADYRGYFDVDIKVGRSDGFVLGTTLGWAKEGGSVQLDFTYPVGEWLFNNVYLYLHMQYVNALAENLLDYQDRTEAFRIGVSFLR
ncbi:phospholipase A [Pontiellaceae bacterium B12227]|nr:phospholipase A [Pontiellaceae bacterium B12227]